MRVLIVEDEKRLAETVRDLMEMNGFTADVCYDGESGLDNALSGIYDVMILDVMLPRKDGFTVLRELRKAGGTVPVLMLTARSELMDKVTGLDSGADYYLTKPFEPRELIACVRALSRRTPEIREDELSLIHISTTRIERRDNHCRKISPLQQHYAGTLGRKE